MLIFEVLVLILIGFGLFVFAMNEMDENFISDYIEIFREMFEDLKSMIKRGWGMVKGIIH